MEDKKEISLSTPQTELEQRLIEETNVDELKNIVNLFNLNVQKKNILRSSKLSDLQDKVYAQMAERLDKKADEFSNQDLLSYFKTIQDTISRSDTSLDKIDVPSIQIHQNQVNLNLNSQEFNRESRARILDAIQGIINSEDTIEVAFQEVTNDTDPIPEDSWGINTAVQESDISTEVLPESHMESDSRNY